MTEELMDQLLTLIQAHVRHERVDMTELDGAVHVMANLMHLADERGWNWARMRQAAGEVYRDDLRLMGGHGDEDE